jgi:hypothetical protein
MIKMKALGAAIILSAAVATPVFARDAGAIGPGNRHGLESQPRNRQSVGSAILWTSFNE